jgi:hypothetical protein
VNRPSALGFRAYVTTFPMLEPMSTGLDALVVSLRVQAVTQSAVTFVLQAGKIGFPPRRGGIFNRNNAEFSTGIDISGACPSKHHARR